MPEQEFVQYLCGSANVDRFYRVTKNAKGYSQIEKKGSKSLPGADCLPEEDEDDEEGLSI